MAMMIPLLHMQTSLGLRTTDRKLMSRKKKSPTRGVRQKTIMTTTTAATKMLMIRKKKLPTRAVRQKTIMTTTTAATKKTPSHTAMTKVVIHHLPRQKMMMLKAVLHVLLLCQIPMMTNLMALVSLFCSFRLMASIVSLHRYVCLSKYLTIYLSLSLFLSLYVSIYLSNYFTLH